MKDGFIKVATRSPHVQVGCVSENVTACYEEILSAYREDEARLIVLPELSITGYTCEDLFWQSQLITKAQQGVEHLIQKCANLDALILVGAPVSVRSNLYNCAIVFHRGRLLGIVPKHALPTYNEFYELRHFTPGEHEVVYINFASFSHVPFGMNQLFTCSSLPQLAVAVEICEDLWTPCPPSIAHAQAGATIICNLSASDAQIGKDAYRRNLVTNQSAHLIAGYVYACAGWTESTQDLVFSSHNLIAENGTLLAESKPFSHTGVSTEIDVDMLDQERRRTSTFTSTITALKTYVTTSFDLQVRPCTLTRFIDPHPFVPAQTAELSARAEDVLSIQAHGLAKRLLHTHTKTVVLGVSGGLDSTLALLVCARAFDMIGLDRAGIIAVTMPGFGTTERTHGNAAVLADVLHATLKEIPISAAVLQHFEDIAHDVHDKDVVYENSQARERTQILMDIANQEGALVIGTGDLSELALGWATYNGDHMSMYAVNVGVPKTLVRHVVAHVVHSCSTSFDESQDLQDVLLDILATPVSPELLPAHDDGTIAQKTEDLVGPYELHDFFLYQVLRRGFRPSKVFRLAQTAFADNYDKKTILMWLKTFYRRFFSQQFKRSCLPDGPKVGSCALSPRGDFRMPSDALCTDWLRELQSFE